MENTPKTTNETSAAPARLEGAIDPHVLNAHLLAASKDDTRKALKGINFKVRDGALHVASCDGRILMHTELLQPTNWHGPDGLSVIVEARKIPCGAQDNFCKFTIAGDRFEIATSKGTCIIPLVKGQVYPEYEQCEIDWDGGAYPEHWCLFDPKMLENVRQYVGEYNFNDISCLRTAGIHDPETGSSKALADAQHAWRTDDGAVRRTVTLMPLRRR